MPDVAGVVQLGVAAGCEQRGNGIDVALPLGYAEDEEAAEDEVERGGREARVRELVGAGVVGADEFFEVALDELEVWGLGQVEAVDGGGGAGGCEGARRGRCRSRCRGRGRLWEGVVRGLCDHSLV